MKLPLVLILTALASRQIQAWERSAIDSRKPGACLHTSYTGTLHEPDEYGEDRCVGTFSGTNFFEHDCHQLSEDCWQSFAQKCKEILGGIIQMVSQSCRNERSRSTVDIDMKSRVVNNGKFCPKTPEPPKPQTEECNRPVRPVCPVQPVEPVLPVQPVQPVLKVQPVRPVHSVHPIHTVQETTVRTEPEYRYPDHHRHPDFHYPTLHRPVLRHPDLHYPDLHYPDPHYHHLHHPHHRHHYEKMLEKEKKHEEKELNRAMDKLEREERHRDKELKKVAEKLEKEGQLREEEDELRESEISMRDRVIDNEFVKAAIREKTEGIKMLEEERRELEGLEEAVDERF